MTGYRPLESHEIQDLSDGTEVIVEMRHWEYKHGYPLESSYYRAIIGHHMTCAGVMADMIAEPDIFFPEFPSWQGRIYAQNDNVMQLWIKEEQI